MRFIFGIVPALLLALILSSTLILSGCSSHSKTAGKAKNKAKSQANAKNKKGKPAAEVTQGEIIGVIEMVNPEQKYVLIRCDRQPTFSTGTELTSIDAVGTPSKLAVTPEHKGYYLTADIKSGSPQVANIVTHQKATPTAATPKTTPATPAPAPKPATPAAGPASVPSALPEISKPSPDPATATQSPIPPQPSPAPGENPNRAPAAPVFEPAVK